MNEHLPIGAIEQILDLCMPSYSAICTRCSDGTLILQFDDRNGLDSFSVAGLAEAECHSPRQLQLLARQLLEEFDIAKDIDAHRGAPRLRSANG